MNEKERYRQVVGKEPHPVWIILSTVALLMIVTGTLVPVFNGMAATYVTQSQWFAYIYAAGALILLISRLFSGYTGEVVRVKRLYRIETWSAIFFCVAAFFLFYDPNTAREAVIGPHTTRDWLAFTLAGGAIQIYTSIAIPRAIQRALKEEK